MDKKKQQNITPEIPKPKPEKQPGVKPDNEPEESPVPEDDPDLIPFEEDEPTPPYQPPEPGEGP